MIITVMARMRSALSSKSRKTSELVIGAIAAAAMPSAARRAMSSPVVVTKTTLRLSSAEDGESDQQHASAAEAVGHRPGGEQQAAERQRVGAGDPLQRGRAAPEVTADRGQRDRQQRVVDHLDEEGEAEGGQGDPCRAQRAVSARRRGMGSGGSRGSGSARGHGRSIDAAARSSHTRRSQRARSRLELRHGRSGRARSGTPGPTRVSEASRRPTSVSEREVAFRQQLDESARRLAYGHPEGFAPVPRRERYGRDGSWSGTVVAACRGRGRGRGHACPPRSPRRRRRRRSRCS